MTLLTGPAGCPDVSGRGGVAVEMVGVVHLYRQAGADVVGLRSVGNHSS
jgi:hypothetical protein